VPFEDWGGIPKKLGEFSWAGDALMLHPPGAGYSVWWFFGPGHRFAGWYVNLEHPSVRWADGELLGIDTIDWDIDITVAPDRSWKWKDEEQFAKHMQYDHYWVDDEAAVRAAGAEAVGLIKSAAFPFDGTWCDFRPDPSWPEFQSLPAGWDRGRAF
jgi:hypothetical protein